jgi:hypothetical protein
MKLPTLSAAILFLATGSALAEQHTVEAGYVGISYAANGQLEKAPQSDTQATAHVSPRNFQVYGGYRLLRYFALESHASKLGERAAGEGDSLVNLNLSTVTGNAVGIVPLGNSGLELYGQLGAGIISRSADDKLQPAGGDGYRAVGTAGFGLRYTIGAIDALTITAGYDAFVFQLEDQFSGDSLDQSVSLARLGMQYNF